MISGGFGQSLGIESLISQEGHFSDRPSRRDEHGHGHTHRRAINKVRLGRQRNGCAIVMFKGGPCRAMKVCKRAKERGLEDRE